MVQNHYYILENFDQLYTILNADILDRIDKVSELPDIEPEFKLMKDGEHVQFTN